MLACLVFYEQDFIDVKIFIWACKLKEKEPQINQNYILD